MAEQFHFDPDTYLAMVREEVPDYEKLQELIADAAGEVTARTILELGTGTGETLRHVVERHPTASVIGIDENDGMLTVARTIVPDADLRVALLQDPLPAGPFDLVFSALAVHHLDAGEKAALFCEVAARLAPGGRFVLGDVVVPEDSADIVVPLDDGYDKPSPVADQLQWLRDAGLEARLRWSRRDLALMVADHT
jgi:tRNA (cmo5U34)-methyltransferase